MIRVRLLWHTPNPEFIVALAMRRCYSAKPIEELETELSSRPGYEQDLIAKALRDKTFDVIEHAVFMFEIEGISRVCCYSEDTEVLTDAGWKFFQELQGYERFATLNQSNFEIQYLPATNFITENYSGRMVHIRSSMVDLLVTPNHRMLFFDFDKRSKSAKTWKIDQAEALVGKRIRLKTDGLWNAPDISEMVIPSITMAVTRHDLGSVYQRSFEELRIPFDSFATFAGFYSAEGSLNHSVGGSYRVCLYQDKHSPSYEQIQNSIRNMGFPLFDFPTRGDIRVMGTYSLQLYRYLERFGKNALSKRVPREIKEASARQIRLYLDSYVKGDGSIYKGHRMIYTSSPGMADDLQELALKAGYSALVRKVDRTGQKRYNVKIGGMIGQSCPNYVVSFRQKASLAPMINQMRRHKRNQIFSEPYSGKVYCVTVPPNGLLYVRRKGRPVWSGNSHQLVRHRIASYDQESQRFSAVEREDFVTPPSVQNNPKALAIYEEFLKSSVETFRKLKELEVPKEDARFILPQSIGTKLVVTANARSLMHFFWQRMASEAQWEIRELANQMLKECKKVTPSIFKDVIEA